MTLRAFLWVVGVAGVAGFTQLPHLVESTEMKLNWPRVLDFTSTPTPMDLAVVAQQTVKSQYNVDTVVKNAYRTRHNQVTHIYLRQTIDGLEVFNGDMNINIGREQQFISGFMAAYQGPPPPTTRVPRRAPVEAVVAVAEGLGMKVNREELMKRSYPVTEEGRFAVESRGYQWAFPGAGVSVEDIPVRLGWVIGEKGDVQATYSVIVHTDAHWGDCWVPAVTGSSMLGVHDWARNASYLAYPMGVNDPSHGPTVGGGPAQRVTIHNPANLSPEGSPQGWHDDGDNKYTDTRGNNVWAQENWSGRTTGWENNERPDGGSGLNFDFPADQTQDPKQYIDAATSNLFLWNNYFHDIHYNYGFDEVSGNFQQNNWGRGGKDKDFVIAQCQDGSGTNNANFMTPPDGQRGRMRMYVWTYTNPRRDGDFEQGIIVHEFHHGLSIRLVGGPDNSNSMSGYQAGGIGEGGGDLIGMMFAIRADNKRTDIFPEGAWPIGGTFPVDAGIRKVPYTTDTARNPWLFSQANSERAVHSSGTVWCTLMWEAVWDLIDEKGFCGDDDWWNPVRGCGNQVFLQNYIDAYKLVQVQPNFIALRNAILKADENNYQAAHRCIYWRAFARRGMGYDATFTGSGWGTSTDGFALPPDCQKEATARQAKLRGA